MHCLPWVSPAAPSAKCLEKVGNVTAGELSLSQGIPHMIVNEGKRTLATPGPAVGRSGVQQQCQQCEPDCDQTQLGSSHRDVLEVLEIVEALCHSPGTSVVALATAGAPRAAVVAGRVRRRDAVHIFDI